MNVSKKFAIIFGLIGLVAGTAGTIALQTHAADNTNQAQVGAQTGKGFMRGNPPEAVGKVTAINGSTLTVTDQRKGTIYTVDASSATLQKISIPDNNAVVKTPPTLSTINISDIKVGDNVMVRGTVNGNAIKATSVVDGTMGRGMGFGKAHGVPGTTGTVTSVSGNTITLTGENGAAYTIDAGNAKVRKISNVAVSDITAGDKLHVFGTTSGTTITATEIMDGEIIGPRHLGTTVSPPVQK